MYLWLNGYNIRPIQRLRFLSSVLTCIGNIGVLLPQFVQIQDMKIPCGSENVKYNRFRIVMQRISNLEPLSLGKYVRVINSLEQQWH